MVTWTLAKGLFPHPISRFDDNLDDLAAMLGWMRARLGFVAGSVGSGARAAGLGALLNVVVWFDPRRRRWNLLILFALGMGVLVATSEALVEGVSPDAGRALTAVSVFVGIEGAGVMLGYALFVEFLGLVRKDEET